MPKVVAQEASNAAKGHEDVAQEADEEAEEVAADSRSDENLSKGTTSGRDIDTSSFVELHVDEKGAQAAFDVWQLFINTSQTREAAGEVIYAALFDSAPSLQSLFVTPRAVQSMKFMNGLASFVGALDNPPALKVLVETLGFGHLHLDVTVPRVVIFRDAIIDVFTVELSDRFTPIAREAWTRLLNYIGGAIIYIKANYAERIRILLASWKVATDGKALVSDDWDKIGEQEVATTKTEEKKGNNQSFFGFGKKNNDKENAADGLGANAEGAKGKGLKATEVPTTFNEMFKFNSAVMGFGKSEWMGEVLDCFHNIVTNVANSARLQEECDVLTLRIATVAKGTVNLTEYKSCMLASLRSLLPKEWSTQHETSWSWLWENVERILQKNMGNPPKWEKALGKVLASLDENQAFEIRKSIYSSFFTMAPAGQDFFKQSNTYLHFIADRVMQMTLEIYKDPTKMVDDVSALGLRHVGYGIPIEFFGPFVSACIEVIMTVTEDKQAVEAYSYALGLISKMLVRTIQEGSTIVMKAINTNSGKSLKKAVSCAPRGERAAWLLLVQVGTQSISPLAWSIESGALESAMAIIDDLLTIRADRDQYYYGMDNLFARHPDIIKTLANDAPTLVPKLLDGLIWRSRSVENGLRRSNYYLKHLVIDANGRFSSTLSWIAKTKDPRLVCHPVIVLLSDTVWTRLACRVFIWRKTWFLFTLLVFILGQSVMKHLKEPGEKEQSDRTFVFICRVIIYALNMTQLLYSHASKCIMAARQKDTMTVFRYLKIPKYLLTWQETTGFLLMNMLALMLMLEPIVRCLGKIEGKMFYEDCEAADSIKFGYSFVSMLAMLLYFVLLFDLAVLSTKVSAYVLVIMRMLSEVGLFTLALGSMLMAFGSSISVLNHDQPDHAGLHKSVLTLLEIAMGMYDGKHYEKYESDPAVLIMTFIFILSVHAFLANMLVAQLTCAYEAVYGDMVGYARLERTDIIVNTMPVVTETRWNTFIEVLGVEEKTEFNAGDLGVTGGFQIQEAANLNPTTKDMIKRYGGSTSVEQPWPAELDGNAGDENDRYDRLESIIQKTLKRVTRGGSTSGSGKGGSNSQSMSNSIQGDTFQDEKGDKSGSTGSSG